MNKHAVAAGLVSLTALLVACGGGGGGPTPPTGGGGGPTPCPAGWTGTAPNCVAPSTTTTAQGILVDDPSGSPLSGITVRLDPWVAYATPGPTPTPIATTTTDVSGHFTISAPNGTYMLVIGPDAVNTPPPGFTTPAPSATDTPIPGASGWRATIHDKIVLNGQTTLVAPTMPPQPMYTPPAMETNGSYRLVTVDALTEATCLLAYNQNRTSLGLPSAVVDEWLQENVRAIRHSVETFNTVNYPNGGDVVQYLVNGTAHGSISGGANCANMIGPNNGANFSGQSQALSPSATLFGGTYGYYTPNGPASTQPDGYFEVPIDPRIYTQPSAPPWP